MKHIISLCYLWLTGVRLYLYDQSVTSWLLKRILLEKNLKVSWKKLSIRWLVSAYPLYPHFDGTYFHSSCFCLHFCLVYVCWNFCVSVDFFSFFFVACETSQRDEINGVLARNVEFSQLIVDYQRKLRESSESLNAAEEHSRKLIMEVNVMFGKLYHSDCCQWCCLYVFVLNRCLYWNMKKRC